jgi:hypothetical protein
LFKILSVLEPAAGPLVSLEIVQLDEVDGDAIQLGFHAPGVTFREVRSGDGGQDLQAHWRNTHPNDLPLLLKQAGIGLGEETTQGVGHACASIREFGFKIPVPARSDGTVVDEHLRLKAAKKMGITEIPAILCDECSGGKT